MRAWHLSAVFFLVGAWACGGTSADDSTTGDGGLPDGTLPDVNNPQPDGSVDDVTVPDDGNTGNDGTTTIDAGPFNPTQLGSGLVLWLDAAKGVTENNSAVSLWADQTSNHNDANGGQGGGAHQPTINATAINNLPAVEFALPQNFNDPSQYLQITDSASLEFGTGDFAIFMVAEYTNTTQNGGQGTFYNKVAGNTLPSGPQLYGNGQGTTTTVAVVRARININDNVNSTAANYNDGKYHRIGIRRTGGTLEVWTDGTSTSVTPDAGGNVDVSASGSDAFIGASVVGNQVAIRLAGGIAEVIGVKGSIASGDVTNLDGYFKTKYAL